MFDLGDSATETDRKAHSERVPPSVLAVILNWNGWKDTLTSVDSVLRLDYPNLRVLVIDNGSTDGSVPQLQTILGDRVELVALPENRGYTGGCNEGFKRALAAGTDWVWLLNSDALIEHVGALTSLLTLAESDPKIALVSPRIAEPDDGFSLTFCGGVCSTAPLFIEATRDPEQARQWAKQYPNAGMVYGAAMLIRTSAIREVGMLDEKFFAYYEDIA
jgi:GT2 family glycosyltransferase